MNPRAIWSFVAGDSRRAPAAVAASALLVLAIERWLPGAGAWIGALYVAGIAAGLLAGVFE